ncbi:hypothetical protein J522_3592 [Acinetobacter baumannii 146457]|nr:hypothetical protein J522_3592 [Acinetobacter baumannii 146457]
MNVFAIVKNNLSILVNLSALKVLLFDDFCLWLQNIWSFIASA